jgi:hypothetical protein
MLLLNSLAMESLALQIPSSLVHQKPAAVASNYPWVTRVLLMQVLSLTFTSAFSGVKSIANKKALSVTNNVITSDARIEKQTIRKVGDVNYILFNVHESENCCYYILERREAGTEYWEIMDVREAHPSTSENALAYYYQDTVGAKEMEYRLKRMRIHEDFKYQNRELNEDVTGIFNLVVHHRNALKDLRMLFPNALGKCEFRLFNADGEEVVHRSFSAKGTIQLSGLQIEDGFYYVMLDVPGHAYRPFRIEIKP